MQFIDLRLAKPILRAVAAQGYTTPTPIQEKAIPLVQEGRDLFGCAQTGTGKTGAFALPVLDRLARNTPPKDKTERRNRGPAKPRALVLCPTRELATQIHDSFKSYGDQVPLKKVVVFGGVNQYHQVRQLKAGTDILVATPGRLLDLINQGFIDLSGVEVFVLDEADRMLDMGFIHDIRKVGKMIPKRRQTLFFSATMPKEIQKLAETLLRDPVMVKTTPVATPAKSVRQSVIHVPKKQKTVLLRHLIVDHDMGRTLVFTRTKHGADRLVRSLKKSGFAAEAIHGNKSQNARTRALDGFKSGRTPILVATDVASRGIDVENVTHVVNFDLTHEPDTYVHRIGRTARAGAKGCAISLCDPAEKKDLKAIERLIGKSLKVESVKYDLASELDADEKDRASRSPRGSGQAKSSGAGGGGRGKNSSSKKSKGSKKKVSGKWSGSSDGSSSGRKPRPKKSAGSSNAWSDANPKPKSKPKSKPRSAASSDDGAGKKTGAPKRVKKSSLAPKGDGSKSSASKGAKGAKGSKGAKGTRRSGRPSSPSAHGARTGARTGGGRGGAKKQQRRSRASA